MNQHIEGVGWHPGRIIMARPTGFGLLALFSLLSILLGDDAWTHDPRGASWHGRSRR